MLLKVMRASHVEFNVAVFDIFKNWTLSELKVYSVGLKGYIQSLSPQLVDYIRI
jgi:hypothetical protein